MAERCVATLPPPGRRIGLQFSQGSEEGNLIERAVLAAERGLCVLWICNTVESLGKAGVRPKGCILVATQVVEQSVDIDAETFKEALGVSHYIYAPYVLWKTIQVWRDRTEVHLPSDIRELLETTYAELDDLPEWVEELKAELDVKRSKLKGEALGLTQIYCGEDDEDSTATRYGNRPTFLQVKALKSINNAVIDKLDFGLAYPKLPEGREPMLSVGMKGTGNQQRIGYVNLSLVRHVWRELGSFLCVRSTANGGGALSLKNCSAMDGNSIVDF